jgi:hypothetical protein
VIAHLQLDPSRPPTVAEIRDGRMPREIDLQRRRDVPALTAWKSVPSAVSALRQPVPPVELAAARIGRANHRLERCRPSRVALMPRNDS